MAQALCPDHSCQQAVLRNNADRIANGLRPASEDTGAYCDARQRLPEELPHNLVHASGLNLEQELPARWLWKERHVKLIDGSTVSMPDTEENQVEYPQPTSQKPGIGFPVARIVGVLSLAAGSVLDLAIGSYAGKKTGEHALLRQLLHCFNSGDIALADAYYCSYFLIATLQKMGVDIVCRLHGARVSDFRRGHRLGNGDHVVTYLCPKRPEWMDEETYMQMPKCIDVREVKVIFETPGLRTKSLVVVTTILDSVYANKDHLAELFYQRWCVELDLRSIKITLQMDVLRCKTPTMVRKEIWVHLLAYNLLRKIMAEAAIKHDIFPRQISFKGAQQSLNAFRFIWIYDKGINARAAYQVMLDQVAGIRVGGRPGRTEPRARKRRPKPYPILSVPRAQAREAML